MRRELNITEVIEQQPRTLFQFVLIALISVTSAIEGFDAQLQAYTAPQVIKQWAISKTDYSLVFSSFQFGTMLGAIVLGSLGDIVGRRKLVVYGVLLFGLFTVLGGYATTLFQLVVTRSLSAVFLGGATPSATALLIDYAPKRRRAFRATIMYAMYVGAAAFGGGIAAWVVPNFGWQSVYLLAGWLSIATGVVLFFRLPESARFMMVRHSSHAKLIATLRQLAPHTEIPADVTLTMEEEAATKGAVTDLFTERRALMTVLLWLMYAAAQMALMFMTSWMPTVFVEAGLGYSAAVISTGVYQGGGVVGSLVCGLLLSRRKGILNLALVFALGVPLTIGIGFAIGTPVLLMLLAWGVGMCVIGGTTGIKALSGVLYPTALRSTGVGWAYAAGRIGSIIGPFFGAILISRKMPLPQVFAICAVPSLVVAGFTLWLGLHLRHQKSGHTSEFFNAQAA